MLMIGVRLRGKLFHSVVVEFFLTLSHMKLIPIPVPIIFTAAYPRPHYSGSRPDASIYLGGGVGVVPSTPLHPPISTIIPVMLSRSEGSAPVNTSPSAAPGSVIARVLLVKDVITPWVPTQMPSVRSPGTASTEFLFPCGVKCLLTLSDGPYIVVSSLDLQWPRGYTVDRKSVV